MFRDMRRSGQLLSQEESLAILRGGTSGVLAVCGDDGYPYAVPLSYVYFDGKIFFHCAKQGHKLDAVKNCGKASFCVVAQDRVVPEEYTTYFRSVIVFGCVRVMEDEAEKRRAIAILSDKYCPDVAKADRDGEIEHAFDAMCMLELTVEHMTGKQAKELMGRKKP